MLSELNMMAKRRKIPDKTGAIRDRRTTAEDRIFKHPKKRINWQVRCI